MQEEIKNDIASGKSNGHASGDAGRQTASGGDNGHLRLHSNALQSWKEIAAYLKRGVRTAQRWERTAGLPVRRPRPGERSPVFAFPDEIDQWMHSRPTRTFN